MLLENVLLPYDCWIVMLCRWMSRKLSFYHGRRELGNPSKPSLSPTIQAEIILENNRGCGFLLLLRIPELITTTTSCSRLWGKCPPAVINTLPLVLWWRSIVVLTRPSFFFSAEPVRPGISVPLQLRVTVRLSTEFASREKWAEMVVLLLDLVH